MSSLHYRLVLAEIFLAVAEIGLPVPTYPWIRTAKLFNLIVLFHICKAPHWWKFDGSCSRKFSENRKNRQIL